MSKKKSNMKKTIAFIGLLALTMSACVAGEVATVGATNAGTADATSGASPRRSSTGEVYNARPRFGDVPSGPVQAKDLYFQFKESERDSVRAYGKNPIAVSGIVTYAGPDIHRLPSIELSDRKGGRTYVLCVFPSFDDIDDVAVGDTVTLSGIFHIMSSSDSVVLKQSTRS